MKYSTTKTFVDLFAGCGGLSLGLENAGYTPIFVNEISPEAMRSYLLNRKNNSIDLSNPSRHAFDIRDITQSPSDLATFSRRLKSEHHDIDLVVGGPPCQGFSGIGHRRTFTKLSKSVIPSNHLFREMANLIEYLQPRAFIFENVRGLLSSRWSPEGERGEVWQSVQQTFEGIGGRKKLRDYDIRSQLIFAKDYGVPQNRPRIIMIGVRSDICWHQKTNIAGGLLPEPSFDAPDLIDLLGDLVDENYLNTTGLISYPKPAQNNIQRSLRTDLTGKILKKGAIISEMDYSRHSPVVQTRFKYMLEHQGQIPDSLKTKKFAQRVLPERWTESGPTITATSLPDDYVHFNLPRTLTVREWARLQMFPDHYKFSGKRTSGGRRRAGDPSIGDWHREAPKYTQIGNAVPVELARRIGEHLMEIIG